MMNPEEEGQQQSENYTAGMQQQGQEVDPKMKKQIDSYTSVLMNLLHGEKTRNHTEEMIKASKDPFIAIPNTAVSVNDMGVNLMEQSGVEVPFGVQLASSEYLLGDIVELGMAMGQWQEIPEEELKGIYEDTLEIVIERGLKDGTIDPIQLQLDVEPLMDEDQARAGNALRQQTGTPESPSNQAMVEQYSNAKANRASQLQAKSGAKQKAIQGRQVANKALGGA